MSSEHGNNLLKERESVYGYLFGILFLIYIVAGYWAAGRTIYADKIMFGTMLSIFYRKVITGFLLGWILIPWVLIRMFIGR